MTVRSHGNAVIAALKADTLVVGDSIQPENSGWTAKPGSSDFIPYIIVYSTGGGGLYGSISSDEESVFVYQLTCVGSTREQSDFMRDKAREVMLKRSSFDITGRKVLYVVIDVPIATSRDDDVMPPVFFSADRFRMRTVPRSL